MKAESTATVRVSAPIWIIGLFGSFPIDSASTLIAPDRCRDWLMIRTAATVITAGSLNPENAVSDGTMPLIIETTSAPIATIS